MMPEFIAKKDRISKEVYVCRHKDNYEYIFMETLDDKSDCLCPHLNTNYNEFTPGYDSCLDFEDVQGEEIRLATPDEKAHLLACIEADEYVEFPEKINNYNIY